MWNRTELTNRDLKMRSKHTKHSKKRLFNETIQNNGTLSGVGCFFFCFFFFLCRPQSRVWCGETKPKATWDFNLLPFVSLQNSCAFGPAKGVYPDVHVVLYIPLKLNSLLNPLRAVIFLLTRRQIKTRIRMTIRRCKSAISIRFLRWSHCSYMNSHTKAHYKQSNRIILCRICTLNYNTEHDGNMPVRSLQTKNKCIL